MVSWRNIINSLRVRINNIRVRINNSPKLKYIIWDLSGIRFIYEKINPQVITDPNTKPPSIIMVWTLSVFITCWALAMTKYELVNSNVQSSLNNSIQVALDKPQESMECQNLVYYQQKNFLCEPVIYNPLSTFMSLSGIEKSYNTGGTESVKQAFLANKKHLNDRNLSNANFSGIDLREANFYNSNLTGADFTNTILYLANFTNADLTNVKGLTIEQLKYAESVYGAILPLNLSNQVKEYPKLQEKTLYEKDLRRSVFINASYTKAHSSKKDLLEITRSDKSKLSETQLKLYKLDLLKLSDALEMNSLISKLVSDNSFQNFNLSKTNFQSANLTGAFFSHMDLKETWLSRANLSNVNISESILENANLYEANLTNAKFSGVNMKNTVLSSARLNNVDFDKVNLMDANLYMANLENADLYGCALCVSKEKILKSGKSMSSNLIGVNAINANLTSANLENANLYNANLTKANLTGANLKDVMLVNTNLSETNFYGTILDGATISNVDLSTAKNLTIDQLKKVKSIKNTILPKDLENEIKTKYPQLLK